MHISRICKLYVQLTNFLIPIEFHELLNLIFDFFVYLAIRQVNDSIPTVYYDWERELYESY